MNKSVLAIVILISLLFTGFVAGAAKKNRKQWKKRKAAGLVRAMSPVSGPANIGGEDLSGPLTQLLLNNRRQAGAAPQGGTSDAQYDNYDETAMGAPEGRTWPRHLDDMFYYNSTPPPYYTLGPIQAIGYHPDITEKHICEEIYEDWVKARHQLGIQEESAESAESAEVVQMFTQVTNRR